MTDVDIITADGSNLLAVAVLAVVSKLSDKLTDCCRALYKAQGFHFKAG